MTKITFDHKALRMLIDELGPDFVLEIRKGILESAIKHHIKNISMNEIDSVFKKNIGAFVKTTVNETIGDIDPYRYSNMSFSDSFIGKIKEKVKEVAERFAQNFLSNIRADADTYFDKKLKDEKALFESRINRLIDRINFDANEKYIKEEIDRRWSAQQKP